MTKKTRPRTDAQESRRALRTLCDLQLKAVCGGNKPGQYTSSSGGGGGTTS